MSNRRRPTWMNQYRTRYLHSVAWHARRDRWFDTQQKRAGQVVCALCGKPGTQRTLELHHLDYHGVQQTETGWTAHEKHADLIALHPRCHEAVHLLIDRDRALAGLVSRRTASLNAIARLRTRIPGRQDQAGE